MIVTPDASEISRRRLLRIAVASGLASAAPYSGPMASFVSPALAQTPVPDDLAAAATDAWV